MCILRVYFKIDLLHNEEVCSDYRTYIDILWRSLYTPKFMLYLKDHCSTLQYMRYPLQLRDNSVSCKGNCIGSERNEFSQWDLQWFQFDLSTCKNSTKHWGRYSHWVPETAHVFCFGPFRDKNSPYFKNHKMPMVVKTAPKIWGQNSPWGTEIVLKFCFGANIETKTAHVSKFENAYGSPNNPKRKGQI